ncbi:MAG: MFS transporter [Chitinophagaceae bacterium]|nr:MAG: MFS transporter [Chitinophagaceae bacterium]
MFNLIANLYKNAYSGLSRRIWLLALVMVINRAGTMVLAFLTLYCISIGFSVDQAGIVVAMYGSGAVVGAFLGGKVSDKVGFYFTQVSALVLGGIMFIVVGRLRGFEMICIGAFILSMVNESFRPANATAIAHYSTPENRTQSFSLVRLAINIGWGIGAAVGGVLASYDYHLLFWVDGFTSIFAGFLLWAILPTVTIKQQNTGSGTQAQHGSQSPYRDKVFLKFMFFQILFALAFFQIFTTVPLYMKSNLKLDEFWIGAIMAANGLLIAVLEMVLVFKLEGRKSYLKLMAYGTIIMGISYSLLNLPLQSGLLVASAFILVITFSEMIAMPFMNTYYISRSTDQNRGQYAGIYTMGWSVAQVAGASGGAWMAQHMGFQNLWFAIAGVCLVTAAGYFFLDRK